MSMAEFTGQTYGDASRQQASQRAVPTGPPPTDTPQNFLAPSADKTKPITSGLPIGEGPGPEALHPVAVTPGSNEDLILTVRAIASRYPTPALTSLLSELEQM
jgi:hypothetical protein